jgi:hypothetical protein
MELFTRNYVHGASTLWKLVCGKLLKIFPFMGSEIPLLCSQVNPFHAVRLMSLSFILILSWQVSQVICSRSKICV